MKSNSLELHSKETKMITTRTGHRWLVAILFIALLGVYSSAQAQDTKSSDEMKEEIKREILQELRSGGGEDAKSDADIRALRESIKREIMEELRKELGSSNDAPKVLKEELKEDLRKEFRRELDLRPPESHPQAVQLVAAGAGHAEGQILERGRGLVGCKVKLVGLSGQSTKFRGYTEGEEFQTITDEQGEYHFTAIPVGDYKIKWELPGDRGWIKRLRNVPDVTVVSGRTSVLKPIETARTLAPQ